MISYICSRSLHQLLKYYLGLDYTLLTLFLAVEVPVAAPVKSQAPASVDDKADVPRPAPRQAGEEYQGNIGIMS